MIQKVMYFAVLLMIFTAQFWANPYRQIYGVTIDNVENLHAITTSLEKLPLKPTTRIVFDELKSAKNYKKAVEKISEVSYIMGEITDSYFMKNFSVSEHKSRVLDYVNTLEDVDIWEIGNEINGDWLGPKEQVVKKAIDAIKIVNRLGKKTALTLHYNKNCSNNPEFDMFTWVNNNLTKDLCEELDYVFVSYYEDDCGNNQPNWQQVFDSLHVLFPNSALGIGECGTKMSDSKEKYMKRYYNMNITTENFVGGYFWWYFKEDCIPYTKPLWAVFNQILTNIGSFDKEKSIQWNNFAFLSKISR